LQYEEKVLKYKDYVVFGRLRTPYFDRMPKQYIENEACFIFVNKGEVSARMPEVYFNLDKNTGLLAKCMNYFFETNKSQKSRSDGIEVMAILLYPSLVKEIFEFEFSQTNFKLGEANQVGVDQLLSNYRESLKILFDNPELADENMIKTKLQEFIILISKSKNAPSHYDFLSALFSPLDIEFKSVIQNNLYADLSLDELASLTHTSLSSFKRKFQESFGDSPKKYLSRKKIEKAATMLKSTESRISDIAYDVGFESIVTFNRNFQNVYQKSPSEYRVN
jgi:AraC family transcriptional regulator, exoenzyme S synthesis regulatory protein ExsA